MSRTHTLIALVVALPTAWAGPATDAHGDPLPPGAVQRLGRVRAFTPYTWNVAFSADGKSVVTANSGVNIAVFDRDTGRQTAVRTLPTEPVNRWQLLAGGERVFLEYPGSFGGGGSRWEVWDTVTCRRLGVVLPGADRSWIAFPSPDGSTIVECRGGLYEGLTRIVLKRWDVRTGRELATQTTELPIGPAPATYVEAPDGRHLLVVQGQSRAYHVACWDPATLTLRWQQPIAAESSDRLIPLAGDTLVSMSKSPQAFDLMTGRPRTVRLPPEDQPSHMYRAHSRPGVLITTVGGESGTKIEAWDVVAGRPAADVAGSAVLKGCWGDFRLSPDGRSALLLNRVPRMYDLRTGVSLWPDGSRETHDEAVTAVAFSADGRRLGSAGADQTARVWDLPGGRCLNVWASGRGFHAPDWCGPNNLNCEPTRPTLDLSSDGRRILLAGAADWSDKRPPSLRVFETDSGKLVGAIPFPLGPATGVERPAFGPASFDRRGDGVVATAGFEGSRTPWEFGRWNVGRAEWATLGRVDPGPSRRATFGPGDRLHVVDRAVNLRTGRPGFDRGDGSVVLACSTDARLAAGIGDPGLPPPPALGSDDQPPIYRDLRVWDVRSGAVLASLPWMPPARRGQAEVDRPFWCVPRVQALHPGGHYLATADANGVRLWDLTNRRVVHTLPIGDRPALGWHNGRVATALAFSPDGSRLATGLPDGTVLLWEVPVPGPVSLPPETAERLWADLIGDDPAAGWRAAWLLGEDPAAAVRLARRHVAPVEPFPADELRQLLTDVESPRFAVRERATNRLERSADLIGSVVGEALKATPSEETRVRLERVMAAVPGPDRPLPAWASALGRAVSVVEHAGGDDGRLLLMAWAGGTPDAFLTREAKAALERLAATR